MTDPIDDILDKVFYTAMAQARGKTYDPETMVLPVVAKAKLSALLVEARIKSEHYWIKYYGDQRKFLDGSDGDIPAIRELDRHQQLHKDRLEELEKQRET